MDDLELQRLEAVADAARAARGVLEQVQAVWLPTSHNIRTVLAKLVDTLDILDAGTTKKMEFRIREEEDGSRWALAEDIITLLNMLRHPWNFEMEAAKDDALVALLGLENVGELRAMEGLWGV